MTFLDALPWIILALAAVFVAADSFVKSRAAPPAAPPRPLTAEEGARLQACLERGNKIEAIKLHRQLTGAGLKDARDAVEAMESTSRVSGSR